VILGAVKGVWVDTLPRPPSCCLAEPIASQPRSTGRAGRNGKGMPAHIAEQVDSGTNEGVRHLATPMLIPNHGCANLVSEPEPKEDTMTQPLPEFPSTNDPVLEDEQTRERFTITDDGAATWAMRKLAALRDKQREFQRIADNETARISEWLDQMTRNLDGDMKFFEGLLIQYAMREREENGRKSVVLPHGSVKSRASSDKARVTDAEAFIKWAQNSAPELLRTKVEPAQSEINAKVTLTDDGIVVIAESGEVVQGVVIEKGSISFNVETSKGAN